MAVSKAVAITEILEIILSNLSIHEIARNCGVSRRFKSLINTSPILRDACWLTPHGPLPVSTPEFEADQWTINPCFERLGISIDSRKCSRTGRDETLTYDCTHTHQIGTLDLRKLVHETPGSWTGMLAFQPPARYVEIRCDGDYSTDGAMYYHIAATSDDGLRMGDLMACFAEMQNRQCRGVDRWAGCCHPQLEFWPENIDPSEREAETSQYQGDAEESDEKRIEPWEISQDVAAIVKSLPTDNVTLRVVVEQAWDAGAFPAFSLRRMCPAPGERIGVLDGAYFMYEMIVHEMIFQGELYKWDDADEYELRPPFGGLGGEYKAEMLRVRAHDSEYLHACRPVYRLLDGSWDLWIPDGVAK